MQKYLFGIAFICLLLSGCCEDSGDLLLNIAFPPVEPTPCDGSKSTPFQSSFSFEDGTYLSLIHPSKEAVSLCITENGIAWYDFQAQTLLAETPSVVAKKVFSYPDDIHVYGNLVCAASATGIVTVDMQTQKLVWERNLPDCTLNGSDFTGVGNRFFAVGKTMDSANVPYETIYSGHIENGQDFGPFLAPKYSRQVSNNWMGYGRVNKIKAFTGPNNEAYLLVSFSEPVDDFVLLNYVGLYNLDRQTWVYERKPLSITPLRTAVLDMAVCNGISARLTLGDSLFVWDVMAGAATHSAKLPMGNYGQNLKGQSIWSNDRLTLIKTSDNEVLAYDNPSNTLLYRTQNVGGYYISVFFDQDLFIMPSYDVCRVFELSSGRELMTIYPPCENGVRASFAETVACWKGINGAIQFVLLSETTAYQYELKR